MKPANDKVGSDGDRDGRAEDLRLGDGLKDMEELVCRVVSEEASGSSGNVFRGDRAGD